MVDAVWAPSADHPFAPPGVFSGLDGGYPAFLQTQTQTRSPNDSQPQSPSYDHLGRPATHTKRNGHARSISRSQSHSQLHEYTPGMLVSAPAHAPASTPVLAHSPRRPFPVTSAANSSSGHSHSHSYSHSNSHSASHSTSHSNSPGHTPGHTYNRSHLGHGHSHSYSYTPASSVSHHSSPAHTAHTFPSQPTHPFPSQPSQPSQPTSPVHSFPSSPMPLGGLPHAHSHHGISHSTPPPRVAVRSNTDPVSPTRSSPHAHFALPHDTSSPHALGPKTIMSPPLLASSPLSTPGISTPGSGSTEPARPRVRMQSMPPPNMHQPEYEAREPSHSLDIGIPASEPVTPTRARPIGLPPPEGKAWVHDPARPNFLPPTCATHPAPLSLLNDTLDITRDYREFVETVGRLELEYGRALQAAVKKFEGRLDAVNTPLPGARKPPATTLTAGMRGHLAEMNTVASLFMKRQDTFASHLSKPLARLDRRGGESARRLGAWNKDIRARWDEGRLRVDSARAKYEAAVREHHAAEVKLRQCAPPELSSGPQVGSEWAKNEKLVAELERTRSDKKKAYLVALAGEGSAGGGGRDVAEGGGPGGWGEEARQLYGHLQTSMLELLRHHVEEDRAHYSLLGTVISRLEATYDAVDLVKDQDMFLDYYTASPSNDEEHEPTISQASTPGLSDSSSTSEPSVDSSHPSLRCLNFVAPAQALAEEAVLDSAKVEDRRWLLNRWLVASNELNSLTDGFSKGPAVVKRNELESVRKKCLDYGANRGLGDPDAMWEKRMNVLRDLGIVERRVVVTKAEMACLEAVLGPNPRPELPHDFKDRAFATPSPCDACGDKVWSPIKHELSCRHCGIALHKACGLHVEPECTGLKSRRRLTSGGRLRRSFTSGAMKFRTRTMYDAPHGAPVEMRTATPASRHAEPLRDDEAIISPFVVADTEEDRAAITEALVAAPAPLVQLARVRTSYPAGGILELSVRSGEVVRILEPDLDGSGWAKVRRGFAAGGRDDEGLVPLYALAPVGASTAPADGGCGTFVSASFTFPPPEHRMGPGEISVAKGAMYELTREGMAFDELWCELLVPAPDGGIRLKGVVPKTYVSVLEL